MPTPPTLLALLSGLTVLAATGNAQAPTPLGKPAAEFPEPFTQVSSIREVPGRRVLVADRQDKVVQLIDFAAGTATMVGREGQGPGEYAVPFSLLPQPGGKTLLQDLLGRRYLEIEADGSIGEVVQLPTGHGAGPGGLMISVGTQQADAKGRIYMQAPPFSPGGGDRSPDSVPVLRWDRSRAGIDTAAWIGVPETNVQTTRGPGQMQMRIGAGKVFEAQEAWGVAADGSVARVTPEPYRVLWYQPEKATPLAGPTVPWTPIKVTEADKQAAIQARSRSRPMMVTIGAGGRRAAPPPNISLPEPEFAETKPPFSGGTAVFVSPEGQVWVRKSQPAAATAPLFDVFDRTGKLIRRVTFPPRTRLVGFGEGALYVARADEDDLEYLQRYAMP